MLARMAVLMVLFVAGCGEGKSNSGSPTVTRDEFPFYSVVSFTRDSNGCSEHGEALSPKPTFVTSERGEGPVGSWVGFLGCTKMLRESCEDLEDFDLFLTKTPSGWREEMPEWSTFSYGDELKCTIRKTVSEAIVRGKSLRLDAIVYELKPPIENEADCKALYEANKDELPCVSRWVLEAKLVE